jgi:hypothetical protein
MDPGPTPAAERGAEMSREGRSEDATPEMATRTFTDGEGRQWAGSVMSGRFAGGEERAEVIFVCEDSPSEAKRFARLDSAPADAAREWRAMGDAAIQALFRDSKIA